MQLKGYRVLGPVYRGKCGRLSSIGKYSDLSKLSLRKDEWSPVKLLIRLHISMCCRRYTLVNFGL